MRAGKGIQDSWLQVFLLPSMTLIINGEQNHDLQIHGDHFTKEASIERQSNICQDPTHPESAVLKFWYISLTWGLVKAIDPRIHLSPTGL